MINYYIGDIHWKHSNIVKYDSENGSRNFSSIEEHDDLIIENINKVVTPQDKLHFVGDVSWGTPEETIELLKRINCKNIFVYKGNHDRALKDGKVKKMFQGVYDIKQIEDNGRQVVICHFPMMMWPGQHRGTIHLYAHLHNTEEERDYQGFLEELNNRIKVRDGDRYKPLQAYNVGCMLWDYTPKTLDEIIEYHKGRN